MNILQIKSAIIDGYFNQNELDEILDAVNQRKIKLKNNKNSFVLGRKVYWSSKKLGGDVEGILLSIDHENATGTVKLTSGGSATLGKSIRVPLKMLNTW